MSSKPVQVATDPNASVRAPGAQAEADRMLAAVRDMIPQLRAEAGEVEALGRPLEGTIRKLHDIGVFKMTVPVEYGGYALTLSQMVPVFAEIARGCGSTAWVVWVTTAGTQWMTAYSHQLQKEMFDPDWIGPYQSGAMNKGGPGIARKVDGGYMLSGKWPWASGCYYTIFHTMGALVERPDGTKYPIICQVPHAEIEIIDDWDVVGMRGSSSNTITLRDKETFVPEHRVIQTMDLFAGKRPEPVPAGLLYDINLIQVTTVTYIALGLGLARAAINCFEETIAGRGITFTTYQKQIEAPITHLQLGEVYSKLMAVEAISEQLCRRVEGDAANKVPQKPIDNSRTRCSTAYALTLCEEIVTTCMRACGASAIRSDNAIQRVARDIKPVTLHGQMNIDTAFEDYGRILAGLPGFQEPPKAAKH